ncbi:hypothetical protein [Nitrospira sp. Nam74]
MFKLKLVLSGLLMLQTISAYAATPPELPRVYVDTSMPTTSITKTVCNSGCNYTNDQLQQAIDEAQLGTTILLQAGAIYTPLDDRGFLLRNKTSGNGWIIIRTSAPDSSLPSAGTRLTPSYANVLPKIVRSAVGNYAMSCDASSHHYRIMGIEFMNPGNKDTLRIGNFVNCDSIQQTTLSSQSHHILFDRVYMHGPSAPGAWTLKFGIVFGGQHQGIIDSTIEEITSSDGEAKAVVSWDSAGPLVIRNNFLSASGENIMIGGATPLISGLTPSDIEFRHNHFYKPLKWRDDPAYRSGPNPVSTKNLFELKNAQRVLIDGNIFENVWPDGQTGQAMVLTPRGGGATGSDSWTTVSDIRVTNNKFINCANGIALSGGGPTIELSQGGPTQRGGRFLFQNNLFVGLGGDYDPNYTSGNFANIGMGPSDVQIKHNTVASYAGSTVRGTIFSFSYGLSDEKALFPLSNFVVQDNLFHARHTPIVLNQAPDMNTLIPGYIWTNTVMAGPWPTAGGYQVTYPIPMPIGNGNSYPGSASNIGYVNLSDSNYHLASNSPYKNAASDGKDIGVDWAEFDAAQNSSNSEPLVASTTPPSSSLSTGSTLTTNPTPSSLLSTGSTSTTTSSAVSTSIPSTTTSPTSTKKDTGKNFLGKLKQLMDRVR